MATDIEQLAFDVGGLPPREAPPPPPRRRAAEPACPASETPGEIAALALGADGADDVLQRCRLLMQLAAAVDVALAVSIPDAYAENGSWRKLSSALGVPFQTLHRRYASLVRDAPEPTDSTSS